MAKASLLNYYKKAQGDLVVEIVLWKLPQATEDRPYGYKYRLFLGRRRTCLVRFDNETGKGDHRHVGEQGIEEPYRFVDLERLFADFRDECERNGWRWEE